MSSSDLAIAVRGVSKQYKIQHQNQRHDTLIGSVLHRLKTGLRSTSQETFWALRDINFEVQRGEVFGVIGRNGAGKSTLFKIMSRITEPSSGDIEMHGRVGSLLEVGTGFHPELTGRENVFLNGAILGMRKSEIKRQFDAIVDFAEVEKFLDTPVKRYSSGMYTRLAFAVAAHLQPEILIVDEVLAVGDAQFQQKCLGKMKDVAGQGRTVLFVSHNMAAVSALTSRCAFLRNGQLIELGATTDVIQAYLADSYDQGLKNKKALASRNTPIRINSITPKPGYGEFFYLDEDLVFDIAVDADIDRVGLRFGMTIGAPYAGAILSSNSPSTITVTKNGSSVYRVILKSVHLAPGSYVMSISIGEGSFTEARRNYDVILEAVEFRVAEVSAKSFALQNWMASYGPIFHLDTEVMALDGAHAAR